MPAVLGGVERLRGGPDEAERAVAAALRERMRVGVEAIGREVRGERGATLAAEVIERSGANR